MAQDELLAWLWQRWEVEVAHREMKSGFGVGEMQCWTAVSTVASVQWGIWLRGGRFVTCAVICCSPNRDAAHRCPAT